MRSLVLHSGRWSLPSCATGLMLADPPSPVTVAIVDSPDPVASGAQLYTITVVNTGGSKLTNCVLTDQVNGVAGIGVPPQLQLTSTRGSCNQNGNLVTCNAGTIEGGGTWVVTIRGVVTAANGTDQQHRLRQRHALGAELHHHGHRDDAGQQRRRSPLAGSDDQQDRADERCVERADDLHADGQQHRHRQRDRRQGHRHASGRCHRHHATARACSSAASAGQTVTCDGGAVNQGQRDDHHQRDRAGRDRARITNTAVVDPDNTIAESNELNNTSALVNTHVDSFARPHALLDDRQDGRQPRRARQPAGRGRRPRSGEPRPDAHLQDPGHEHERDARRRRARGRRDAGPGRREHHRQQVIVNGTVGTSGGCTVAAPQVTCSIKTLNPGGTMDDDDHRHRSSVGRLDDLQHRDGHRQHQEQGRHRHRLRVTTVRPAVDLTITKADAPTRCARVVARAGVIARPASTTRRAASASAA